MSKKIFTNRQTGKTYDRDKGVKHLNNKKRHKLGTKKNPAIICVQTDERKKEINAIFQENNWAAIITVSPDRSEDISALKILLNPIKTKVNEHNLGRNEPCYCGSKKKFKKCCGK